MIWYNDTSVSDNEIENFIYIFFYKIFLTFYNLKIFLDNKKHDSIKLFNLIFQYNRIHENINR